MRGLFYPSTWFLRASDGDGNSTTHHPFKEVRK